jgi:hypothetical protein
MDAGEALALRLSCGVLGGEKISAALDPAPSAPAAALSAPLTTAPIH